MEIKEDIEKNIHWKIRKGEVSLLDREGSSTQARSSMFNPSKDQRSISFFVLRLLEGRIPTDDVIVWYSLHFKMYLL